MIQINPPPFDGRCEICNRPQSELPGLVINSPSPLDDIQIDAFHLLFETEDFKLMKCFRMIGTEDENNIASSWECIDCINLSDEEAWLKKKYR